MYKGDSAVGTENAAPGVAAGRRDLRWFALAVWVLLAGPGLPEALGRMLSAASPFAGGLAALAARAVIWSLPIALVLGLWAVMRPRAICRWACPLGPLADLLSRRPGPRGRAWPRALGRSVLMVGVGLAAFGVAWGAWLDPFVMTRALSRVLWQSGGAVLITASASLLPMLISLIRPGAWCASVCPLGALQDLLVHRRAPARGAVHAHADPVRRRLLRGLGAFGLGAAGGVAARGADVPPLLRPPGAMPELDFRALCLRCGQCAAVCPSRIIRPDTGGGGAGWTSWWTPRLDFSADFCRPDCVRCTQVCPSGALRPIATVADKAHGRIGLAVVDFSLCWLTEGRECAICRRVCPYDAIRVVSDGFDARIVVDPDRCTGCGACEAECPTEPAPAIAVRAASKTDEVRPGSAPGALNRTT